jgi:hypothetical protein
MLKAAQARRIGQRVGAVTHQAVTAAIADGRPTMPLPSIHTTTKEDVIATT